MTARRAYKRVLLKVSGEALMGRREYGLDTETLAAHRRRRRRRGRDAASQVCLVIGGGNIFRGVSGAAGGMDRAQADYMGMLATVMNALAMQSALERHGVPTRVQSAIPMAQRLRALYPPPRRAAHGEGPGGDLRRRHRQPVLHHRHRRRPARRRDGLRRAAEGHPGGRRLFRRPAQGPATPSATTS